MSPKDIPEFTQMTTPEKILLLEDLWESIASEESGVPVSQSHRDELDARPASFEANPGTLLSLQELQARIEKRK